MPIYTWEGKAGNGKTVKGELDAASQQAVFNILRAQRISPNMKKIREKGQGLDRDITIPGLEAKPSARDLVLFTRQFATMIDAGLPIVQALDVLGKQAENKVLRRQLKEVKANVENGGTLADSLEKHPRTFDELFVNMVAAGETGGILDIILERMASYLEKMDKLRREAMTAMIYPAVVVLAAMVVTSILLIFVIPTFAEVFADFGAALPAPTRFVITLSEYFVAHWATIFGSMFAFVWLFRRFARTDKGKRIIHPVLLKMPVFGELVRKIAVARFSRTLSTMLSSGVPILDALLICGKTAGNKVVQSEVNEVRLSISEGKPMSEPLVDSAIFPPMVIQMISVGETTGALDAMLGKIADFYEDEVNNAVGAMKQLIEPLMILFLGGLIGGLVIAMYLPIFKLGNVV